MKVFIAGARSIKKLDGFTEKRIKSICDKEFSIIIGDCYGVDAEVQKFCAGIGYDKVTVFASNGRARNNIGHWRIKNVPVSKALKGFDFYKEKDLAMAQEADYGFMIWDGESRGTLNNIIQLAQRNKEVVVHFPEQEKAFVVKSIQDIEALVETCGVKAKENYQRLMRNNAPHETHKSQ